MTIEHLAHITYEANRALCETHRDWTQTPWEKTSAAQRASRIEGVRFRLKHPDLPPAGQHEAWMRHKQRDGWTYGPTVDEVKKTHPCLLPWDQLEPKRRAHDHLFVAIVDALRGFVED